MVRLDTACGIIKSGEDEGDGFDGEVEAVEGGFYAVFLYRIKSFFDVVTKYY